MTCCRLRFLRSRMPRTTSMAFSSPRESAAARLSSTIPRALTSSCFSDSSNLCSSANSCSARRSSSRKMAFPDLTPLLADLPPILPRSRNSRSSSKAIRASRAAPLASTLAPRKAFPATDAGFTAGPLLGVVAGSRSCGCALACCPREALGSAEDWGPRLAAGSASASKRRLFSGSDSTSYAADSSSHRSLASGARLTSGCSLNALFL
mmetsp:Transcript_16759/g.36781  ORF Transcript_16759/g.36781 Transcript_16759/m.36781 type:complete len:208 (-) Transcript_16759:387-1010(-)